MRIVIHSPPYDPKSGGIIVLHKLCDLLIQEGFDAGFYVEGDFLVNSSYKYKTFTKKNINLSNDIVVYPEIIFGNPIGAKNVVRYILNRGHVTLNRKDTWGKDDYWIYFSKRFYDNIQPLRLLNVLDSKIEHFKDYNLPRTYEECFTYRKQANKIEESNIIHSKNAIEIYYTTSDEDLIKIFNTCKKFYCYDPESYISVLASLCGCDSIIVPNKKFDRNKVINNSPCFSVGGVAYGENEINLARNTRSLLVEFLQNKELTQKDEVNKIFTQIIKHFNN